MRRLTTILFSDIHGFSRQMSVDEVGMLKRLAEHNRIFDAELARHGGRVVKRTGDGYMVEFQSTVASVQCAIDVQRALSRRALEHPEEPVIGVRIGVHLGDVLVSADGDLLGDAVNIAARLEQICPVGSVAVSHSVYEQARGKINAEGESLGHVRLKNIARKVRVYVLHPADERLTVSGILPKLELPKKSQPRWVVPALVASLLVVATVAALRWRSRTPENVTGLPRRGGTLRIASTLERGALSPYGRFRGQYKTALEEATEPLFAFGTGTAPAPAVIDRLEERDGGKTVLLHMRSGVRFHPHPCLPGGKGRAADAEDVVFSLRSALDASAMDAEFEELSTGDACPSGASAQDPCRSQRHVVARLRHPSAFFDQELTHAVLLPRELKGCDDLDNLRQPVGTGPFAFTSAPTGDDLVLERFDGSWRAGADGRPLPYVDRLELRQEPDIQRALSRLARGEVEVVTLTANEAQEIVEQGPSGPRLKGRFADLDAQVAANVYPGITFAGLYLTGRPGLMERPEVRRALSLSLDRARLATTMGRGLTPHARFLEPRMMGATPAPEPAPDLAGAKQALVGVALAGELLIAHTPERREPCAILLEGARSAGLPLRCVEMSLSTIGDPERQSTFDAFLASSVYDLRGSEPWPYLGNLASSADLRDEPEPRLAAVVSALAGERDRAARATRYRELENRLLETLAIIPIGVGRGVPDTYLAYWVIRNDVHGLTDPATGRTTPETHPLSQAWLQR